MEGQNPSPPGEGGNSVRAWLDQGALFVRQPGGEVRRLVLGKSPAIQNVLRAALKAAPSQARILILGESGVGKGFLAWIIHLLSDRCEHPFMSTDCGSSPETLIASDLFGHEKGAFTGAIRSKAGRFELAQGGTIFLDEVGNYTQMIQTILLKILQEREYERVGGTATLKTDARIIAASNRDLVELCRKGVFRSDLFYRLNVITLRVPPLRDRREDIPVLVGEFLPEYARVNKRPLPEVSPGALAALSEYDWPGNVRELQNCVERMVVMADGGKIDAGHIPAVLTSEVTAPNRSLHAEPISSEKETVKRVLLDHKGNISASARTLGINRSTLYRKMRKLGITL